MADSKNRRQRQSNGSLSRSEQELESVGVSQDRVRLSIGIEHIDDILTDIDQALAVAKNS